MADRIAVILSRHRTSRADREGLEQQLVDGLAGRHDVELRVVPHLYDLAADGPGVRLLKSIAGEMIVLAWLYPRSTFWVLDAHRVRGRLGRTFSLPDAEPDEVATRANTPDMPDRTIWCFDLRTYDCPEPYLKEIGRIAETVVAPVTRGGAPVAGGDLLAPGEAGAGMLTPASASHPAGRPNEVKEATRSRWYPVIDYGRCTNCLECLNFCLFGVYGLDESEVIVAEEPDACRPGCPACARICPSAAIMFPQHKDAAIAGDPQASPQGLKLDLSQLFGGADPADVAAAERDRALAERRRQEAELPPSQTTPPPAKDDLDRLVDEVDELDL